MMNVPLACTHILSKSGTHAHTHTHEQLNYPSMIGGGRGGGTKGGKRN